LKREYYIGFDGGGTKTECVLLDGAEQLLATGLAGPSNPLRAGFEQAFVSLAAAAGHVLTAARIEAGQIDAVCAGIAGAGRPRVRKKIRDYLVGAFPRAVVHVTTDLDIALEAVAGEGPGVVLVAGTGSAAYGRDADGRTARAGGHGPWIGDEGSAFDIGRRAVAAVAQARDGMAPVTSLADMIPAALECADWETLLESIAEAPDEVLPRIFPIVAQAAGAEDSPAQEILYAAAVALSALAISVARRLDLADNKFALGKIGGVFGHSPYFDSALEALLISGAKRAEICTPRITAACAAARLARRLLARAAQRPAHDATVR
jgi:N-acetylglucosamine kinase-like BadF-type ATPase